MDIALAHTFVKSVASMDSNDERRVARFLEHLTGDPDSFGTHTELIHEAPDRSVRSMRVSDDLRAIVRRTGDQLLVLFVGHHQDAYEWARRHCYDCDHPDAGRKLPVSAIPGTPGNGLLGAEGGSWHCVLLRPRDIHAAMTAAARREL